jgi:hypothetical protein
VIVNVVVKRGWILERMALELERTIPGVTVNCGAKERTVDPGADLIYYMPAKDALKYPFRGRTMGLFTHGPMPPELVASFVACTAMNETTAAALHRLGAKTVIVTRPGTAPARRPPVFGVIGRPYNSGRKGEELVVRAVDAGFRFVACAPPEKIRATTSGSWGCRITHGIDSRDAFFQSINYLVITSLEEGGPVPLLEALARHVPVIAPDVGWCWEFPVIRYERGSWESLRAVLEGLSRPPTWAEWAERHRRLFVRLLEKAA